MSSLELRKDNTLEKDGVTSRAHDEELFIFFSSLKFSK